MIKQILLVILLPIMAIAQTGIQDSPRTPGEATKRIQEQMNGQSGSLEFIEQKQKQLAIKYLSILKNKRWIGEELLNLAELSLAAEQYKDAEKFSLAYFKSSKITEARRAHTDLLAAYSGEKNYLLAISAANLLIAEQSYDYEMVTALQQFIDRLRIKQPALAVNLAEKMLPKLFKYFENKDNLPSSFLGEQMKIAYKYGLIYQELGNPSKAKAYFDSFLAGLNSSSLGADKSKELLREAELNLSAEQYADAEKRSLEYLKLPEIPAAKSARINLLEAYLGQRKYSEGVSVANILTDEASYDYKLVSVVERFIDEFRTSAPHSAILLAEKMLPNLLKYAGGKINIPPPVVAQLIGNAFEYGSIYRDLGENSKADSYNAYFLAQFNSSSVSSNKIYRKAIDAAVLRMKMYGMSAPAVEELEYIDMPNLNLSDLKGKVVMLDFMAHWCVECIESIPSINSLQEKYASQGLKVIGVTKYYGFFGSKQDISPVEELAKLKEFKAQRQIKYGLLLSTPKALEDYGITALPTTVLIDKKGKIRFAETGYNKQRVEKIIAMLINEN